MVNKDGVCIENSNKTRHLVSSQCNGGSWGDGVYTF